MTWEPTFSSPSGTPGMELADIVDRLAAVDQVRKMTDALREKLKAFGAR